MGKFEESWKEVFEGIEVTPSDSAWANIDRDLSRSEGATMRRRIAVYQRIAAASVLFALLVGSLGVYRWTESKHQLAPYTASENKVPEGNSTKIIDGANHRTRNTKDKLNASNQKNETGHLNSTSASKPNVAPRKNFSDTQASTSTSKNGNEPNVQPVALNLDRTIAGVQKNRNEEGIVADENIKKSVPREMAGLPEAGLLPIPEIHEGPVIAYIVRKLPAIPGAFMAKKENKITHEQVWASVTTAAGNYKANTNTNAYSNANFANSALTQTGSSSQVGSSFSFGMLAGVRVTKRVVVQSGIQYMNQSFNSTSNVSSLNSPATVASKLNSASPAYSVTSPYTVTSASEFVSLPVQAGYLLIDKKMGLQLNSGLSTDFFLRNTLSDPSGQRQSYSQSAGQDSPYRSVNFSGLMSSEVSYKLGNRYRVSVVPGFRYAFNPDLKTTVNSSGNPLAWDVGFRFRYIFR